MTLARGIKTASALLVICTVLNFGHYTHAYEVSNPVCKWNNSKDTCEKDPSKMIDLLTSTDKMFGLLMRCQYATKKSKCNRMSQNTCIWKNNACRISSEKLINQINDCFYKYSYQNEINKCKNELKIISKNTTWIDQNSVLPTSSCEDTVGYFYFTYSVGFFDYTWDTCQLMEYALQCSSTYSFSIYSRCRYGSTDTQAYQLVSDLRYIMGVSTLSVSSSLSLLEDQLDIKSGNLQLYDSCSSIKSSYQCERSTKYYQWYSSDYTPSPSSYYTPSSSYYSPSYSQRSSYTDKKSNINIAIIIVPIFISALFCFVCCCAIKNRQNARNATENVGRTSQNVQLTARVRTVTEQQTNDLETAETMEIIERLPNLEFKVQKGHESSEAICCICLDSLNEGDPSTVLPCAHWFHKDCLNEWIRTKGRNVACPLCNNALQNTQQLQQ